jgi:hypothetical protein
LDKISVGQPFHPLSPEKPAVSRQRPDAPARAGSIYINTTHYIHGYFTQSAIRHRYNLDLQLLPQCNDRGIAPRLVELPTIVVRHPQCARHTLGLGGCCRVSP